MFLLPDVDGELELLEIEWFCLPFFFLGVTLFGGGLGVVCGALDVEVAGGLAKYIELKLGRGNVRPQAPELFPAMLFGGSGIAGLDEMLSLAEWSRSLLSVPVVSSTGELVKVVSIPSFRCV